MNTNAKSKRTRVYHFLLLLLCVSMTVFTTGCSNDSEDLLPTEATDDASLVAAQLKQLQRTRANDAYNTVIITTAKQIALMIEKSSSILVDWGDGNREYDVFTHTYTDNLPAHTIMLYSPDNNAITALHLAEQSVIYLDITKNPALQTLNCGNNRLTELDVTQNTNIYFLICPSNRITTLNTTQNRALLIFEGSDNLLATMDLSQNIALVSLDCQHNQLTTLDASQNTNLTEIYCGYNQLTALNTPATLDNLDCRNNELTSLDISGNTGLFTLYCGNNKLTALDLSNKTKLSNLSCENNQLTTLNVSTCPALKSLICYKNPLETTDQISALAISLPNRTGMSKGSFQISNTAAENAEWDYVQFKCTQKNWDIVLK